jgi:hypothetical protein
MPSNVELELQLKAAQKDIKELQGEVAALKTTSAATVSSELATLREVLDRTFKAIGSGTEYHYAKRNTVPVNAATLAAQLNEAAPQPKSAALTASDFRGMATALGVPSSKDALQFAKDAVKTAKGE